MMIQNQNTVAVLEYHFKVLAKLLLLVLEKEGKFAVSIECPKAKMFQLQGGFVPCFPSASDLRPLPPELARSNMDLMPPK